MEKWSHIGLVSIFILMANHYVGGTVTLKTVRVGEVSGQSTLAVNGLPMLQFDANYRVIVLYTIIVDEITDEQAQSDAKKYLLRCAFPEPALTVSGSMNTERRREAPYELHINGKGIDYVTDNIIESAITIKFDNVLVSLAEILEKAKALRVLVLKNISQTARASINVGHQHVRMVTVFKMLKNAEPSKAQSMCRTLKQLPCLREAHFDNWTGEDFNEIVTNYLSEPDSEMKYILHHVTKHKFVLSREKIVKVEIKPYGKAKLADTIESVLGKCSFSIFLSILIGDETVNKLSEILPCIESFGAQVQQLALINFGENLSVFLKANVGWFRTHLSSLNTLHFAVTAKTLSDFGDSVAGIEAVGDHLGQQQWPASLEELGLIVTDPDKHLKDWEHSKEIKIDGISCVVCFLKLSHEINENNGPRFLDHSPTFGRIEEQQFAHSQKCTVP